MALIFCLTHEKKKIGSNFKFPFQLKEKWKIKNQKEKWKIKSYLSF